MAYNPRSEIIEEDVVRYGGLELKTATEDDDGEHLIQPNTQHLFQRLQVAVVLVQRVLESEPIREMYSRPELVLLVSENPAGATLQFDHEQSERRNDEMVDLGSAT